MPVHRPAFDDFLRMATQALCVPIYRQLTGDGLTPVSAFQKIARSGPSFLFESVIGGEKVGRFSFLGTGPFLSFEARGPEITITPTHLPDLAERRRSADPFEDLHRLLEEHRAVHLPGLPRFSGGAVGFASYDAV